MHLVTTITIQATRQQIWHALFDPHLLGQCMPGLTTWQEVEPQRIYHLLVAWGTSQSSQGLQVPVIVTWGDMMLYKQIGWEAEVFWGRQPLKLHGNIGLRPEERGVCVEVEARMDVPSPIVSQMAQNAAPKIVQPFFKCLRHHLEERATREG